MLYFKCLADRPAAAAYVPERHLEIARRIYHNLGAPVTLAEGKRPTGRAKVSVQLRGSYVVGMIRVRRVGRDSAAEVRRALRDLCEVSGAEPVYLELPLAQPGKPDADAGREAAVWRQVHRVVGPHRCRLLFGPVLLEQARDPRMAIRVG